MDPVLLVVLFLAAVLVIGVWQRRVDPIAAVIVGAFFLLLVWVLLGRSPR